MDAKIAGVTSTLVAARELDPEGRFIILFAQMHRNAILSRITDTKPNQLEWEFYLRIFTFGGIPRPDLAPISVPADRRQPLSASPARAPGREIDSVLVQKDQPIKLVIGLISQFASDWQQQISSV